MSGYDETLTEDEPTQASAQSQETALTPGGHEPFEIPGDPGLPACPVCKIGVLYTIAYDEDAIHEQNQKEGRNDPTAHDHFVASGGSIRLKCFNCDQSQTQALNPEDEA